MILLYKALRGVFGILASYSYGELALATLLYRLPIVLIVGLLIGLILSRVQYPRLLVYCLLAWPTYYFFEHLLLIGLRPAVVASLLRDRLGAEMSVYCVEYVLLFVVILVTNAAVVRSKKRKRPSRETHYEAARP